MSNETMTGTDLEVLTELNRAYIASVQHSDVARFDQILAGETGDDDLRLQFNREAGRPRLILLLSPT